MKIIETHPDNEELVRRIFTPDLVDGMRQISWITIQTNRFMERDKPTGEYILPDGRKVFRESIQVSTRFIDYGPEDVGYLVMAGIIAEELEPLYYEVSESMFRIQCDWGAIRVPRGILSTATS